MIKKVLFTCLLAVISLNGNAQDWWGNSKIKGNGKVTTVTRNTSDYRGVSVGGSFDVVLVKGKEGKIKIEGEENIIPYIETEVEKGILKVKYKKNMNIRTTKRLTVTVPFQDIESVSLGGSGNISGKSVIKTNSMSANLGGSGNITLQVEANEVSASIGGSGNINLEGTTEEFNCKIAGSGGIRAYDLKTDKLNAKVAGSGSIKSFVKSKIQAKIVGSGSIYYKGNPTHIDTKSVGSGDVISRN